MQSGLWQTILFITSIMLPVQSVAAPKAVACVPPKGSAVPNEAFVACHVKTYGLTGLFTCDKAGSIEVNLVENTMHISIENKAWPHTFTFHGTCVQAGKIVSTSDLHIEVPAHQAYSQQFRAFTNGCDPNQSAATTVKFLYHSLSKDGAAQCLQHPVQPIS